MKIKLLRITILIIAIVMAVTVNGGFRFDLNKTAYAVGDLSVDWGVPDGDPIFVENNMAPGDVEDRDVDVTNSAASPRTVGVKGVRTSGIGDIESVLEIVISEGGTDLYGGTTGTKTLADFFADSTDINGIALSSLSPSDSTTYNFEVTFLSSSGNEFQATSVVFDITIGIVVEVPEECSEIDFDGEPIFGTSRAENLHGTPGNDLIFGFEGGDKIEGNSGDDCLVGGEGSDRINGNAGNDVLLGQGGSDSLKGNNGNDHLIGGDGSDSLDGGNGEDTLEGGEGSDSLSGGNENDALFGGGGSDSLKGDNGNDQLEGGAGSDSLKGGAGDDDLDGGDGIDALNGEAGTDACLNGESVKNCES